MWKYNPDVTFAENAINISDKNVEFNMMCAE